MASVPAGPIQDHQGVFVVGQLPAEILQIQAHGRRVDLRKQAAVRFSVGRLYRAVKIYPLEFHLANSLGPAALLRPYSARRALLAETGLVLEPQSQVFAFVEFLRAFDPCRQGFFLNSSRAWGEDLGCTGRGSRQAIFSRCSRKYTPSME